MKLFRVIARREIRSYFVTPLAWVFSITFLLLAGLCTFYPGAFYTRGEADLLAFFKFMPWLFIWLASALAMPMWADERKSGSIELLLSFPVSMLAVMVGKFSAAWLLVAINLILTMPIWLTVNYLGTPDNRVIAVAYAGSFLMAGAYLAIGAFASTLTRNQIVAFIVTVVMCLLLVLAGMPDMADALATWLPQHAVDGLVSLGFIPHFLGFAYGIVDVLDVVYFVAHILFWLLLASCVLKLRHWQG